MTATTTAPTATETWTIDPAHTEVGFAVKHLMISTVRGRFASVSGTILLDESNPANSSVRVAIDAASIDTRQAQRDAHLRSADFFDAGSHPTIDFVSRRVERAGGDLRITGDLTIRGVKREVTFEATDDGRSTDPYGNVKAGFSGRTKLDRRDFGLTWNQALETGGVMVSNEVIVSLDVQAVRATG